MEGLIKDSRECQACGCWGQMDACHIVSKGAGGGDEPNNILFMCRLDHQIQHKVGFHALIGMHPHLENILRDKGHEVVWEGTPELGSWKLRRI